MPSSKQDRIIARLLEERVKLGTVSGIWTTKPETIKFVDINIPEIELITTKSYQVNPNPGNREPIIVEDSLGNLGNAVGLRNPGMEKGYKDLKKLREEHKMRALLNVSLSASSIDDFVKLVKRFEDVADILELNFSCPHAKPGFGSSIGSDANVVAEYMKELREVTNALLFPKLTPNVDDISAIAMAAINNGADGISAINTVGPEIYVEPHTGKPILTNVKGGKSGDWIKNIAIKKILEIRRAVGVSVPIIGMGGISFAEDVKKLYEVGADVVGIGSVLSRVKNSDRPRFFSKLEKNLSNEGANPSFFVSNKRVAEYFPYTITEIVEKGPDLRLVKLDGKMDYKSSQFAFLWIPDVGEKPFSIAQDHPLSFIVRKREYDPSSKKGLFTDALFKLKEGDELMVRGPYGAVVDDHDFHGIAVILAGGTGIAVAPKLAQELSAYGRSVSVYHGVTFTDQTMPELNFGKSARYIPVEDQGIPGRVIDLVMQKLNSHHINNTAFYNIGPIPFMQKAMKMEEQLGADPKSIFSSIETRNMCGIGVCGECACGPKLTCHDGTFFTLQYLIENNIDISDL